MYISEQLKETIKNLVEQGYIRDSENIDYIADKVTFKDNKFFFTFTDYSQSTHEYWEDEEECTDEPFDDEDLKIKETKEERLIWSKM